MRKLHHFPLCPFSRKIRIILAEKRLDYDLIKEKFWERSEAFLRLNPAGELPILLEAGNQPIADHFAITEYLESRYPDNNILSGNDFVQSAEIRRVAAWFDRKLFREVTKYFLYEKVVLSYQKQRAPHSGAIRAAQSNIHIHMRYIDFLLQRDKWLVGDQFSLADISAAAQFSVMDYLGEVPWREYPEVKIWYALIKSRPCFKSILQDRVSGFLPPKHYANPDF